MIPRIGVYICHCGTNIGGKVDSPGVAQFAGTLKNVVVSRDYKFMCSDPGQEMIVQDIHYLDLNRVVVASCSPRLHEKTFQNVCLRAGLNPFLFQMACIREHCSWVIKDPDEATRKAKHLVKAAVQRVNYHHELFIRQEKVNPDIMVIGAGIAGIQAALDIAASGHKVHLVEKDPSIGGNMMKFDKTFPTLDCAACISTPKTVAVAQNPNINLLTYSEVQHVDGFVGNFKVQVLRHPRYVLEDKCTGCGQCREVCPVDLKNEFEEGLSTRKAIYMCFPQAVPQTHTIDKAERPPCQQACPAGANVQGYIQMIKAGKYEQALRIILERIPLPGVLGRVCPHYCEDMCRRQEVDQAVSIRELKRFVADNVELDSLPPPQIEERKEKVAVIGSGPAGLSTAYYLRLMGYQTSIFEALDKPGGMLRACIPDYRLPPEILDREINFLLQTGIDLQTGVSFGEDITLQDLKNDGFEAVFLAIGAHAGKHLNVPGWDDGEGQYDAINFLCAVNRGEKPDLGKEVAVIGGGNVAMDAARCARRLGCDKVLLIYRRSRQEMPAYEDDIQAAQEEGIQFLLLCSPKRIVREDGAIIGLEYQKNELGPPDASGRRRPQPIQGSTHIIPCQTVISAIGQQIYAPWLSAEEYPELSEQGTIQVNPQTMQTNIPYVFCAGDAAIGPASVVEAIGGAHKAIRSIHHYLQDLPVEPSDENNTQEKTKSPRWKPISQDQPVQNREKPEYLLPEKRITGFAEECMGLTRNQAEKEAARCLNCGGCCECMECVSACEAKAIDHNMQSQNIELEVGSVIVATGFQTMDASRLVEYGYGRFKEVYTGLEFERLNNATGPTGGEIVMKDGRKPQSVGIIHCAGSRDVNYHQYCSRVCCMYALKYAHLLHEKVGPQTEVVNFFIDLRCFGKNYEEFLQRIQNEGTTFIRGRPAQITKTALNDSEKDKLIIQCEDTLLGKPLRVPVDMVILCTAVEARNDAPDMARILGISQGHDGFFLEEHPKLGPVTTANQGIYLAGSCQGMKDIPDSVAHASGAAAQALSLATRGNVEISPVTSKIDPDICIGCQTCISLCAYSAITFDPRRRVSVVNEAMCKGCGSCAAFCPSGAAQVNHFSQKQIFSELEGLLDTQASKKKGEVHV